VDFPLRAVLVDTSVSLARLAQLQPGMLIPVALNRSVPLLIEQAVIAHGTAGEVDDRIALEISHTSLPGIR
jgi:flagellar motor switch protein FliM